MRPHPPHARLIPWAAALTSAAAVACSAPTGGPPPELTYTQASIVDDVGVNAPVAGAGNTIPFSSQPLVSLNADWSAYAMDNSSAHGVHLFTGLNAGVCMDVNYALLATGNAIDIYTCNLLPTAQIWTMVDGQIQIPDAAGTPYCLSLAGGSLDANTAIIVACTPVGGATDPTQLWRWEGGLLRLVDSNQCLSLTSDSPSNSQHLATYPCDANNAVQQWRLGNVGLGAGNVLVPIGARISSRLDSATCLDLRGGDAVAGVVETYACNTTAAQKWVFEAGTISTLKDNCIAVDGAATAGSNIRLAACSRGDAKQQWVWSESTLMLAGTNLCMCVPPGVAPGSSPQLALGACPSSPSSSLNCQWLLGLP